MYTVLLVIHTILVLFLIGLVLLQRSDSDGLSGLGGGGGNQFMTGRAKANLMTRATAILAAAFMITSLTLAVMASHMTARSIVDAPLAAEAPLPANNRDAVPTAIPGKEDIIKAEPETKNVTAEKGKPGKAAAEKPVVEKPEPKPVKAAPSVPKPE